MPRPSTNRSTVPAAKWRTGSRNASSIWEPVLGPAEGRTRGPTAPRQRNQLRLWFSSLASVLLEALRRIGLPHTELAQATCGTIRLKLLKLGARVTVSVRRIKIAIASACPHHAEFALAHAR